MKPNQIFNKFLLGAVLMAPALGAALPLKYADCGNVKIKEVPGSTATYFNEDCSVVYVAPPRIGKLTISGINPTGFPQYYCADLEKVEETNDNLSSVALIQSRRMAAQAKEIEKIERDLADGLVPVGKKREEMENRLFTLMDQMDQMKERQTKWRTGYVADKAQFAHEGGWGSFTVENTYSELVQAYRDANPNLRFERLPLDQSFLTMVDHLSTDNDIRTDLSAILSMKAEGVREMPVLAGSGSILKPEANIPSKGLPDGADIFGDSLTGEIRLTQLGYCPLWKKGGTEFDLEDVKNYFSGNATYQYQVQVMRRHSITYNLQELVKQIHEQTKKSGFLSRSTMNSFIDERSSNSWITFHVDSQDQRFEYTDEYIRDVKKEFLDRALAQVVAIQTGNPTAHLSLIDPSGKNGADVIGDELQKCPHLYCQIGAGGFKVLSALFGSTSATSRFIKSFNGSVSEVVTEKKMVPQIGTMTFN